MIRKRRWHRLNPPVDNGSIRVSWPINGAVAQPTGFETGVFFGVVATVAKLALICGVIRFLTQTGRIPGNSSTVLSKLSYELVIPCLSFTRLTSLLTTTKAPYSLIGLSVAMIFQILVGAFLGWLSWRLITWIMPTRQISASTAENRSHHSDGAKHEELGLLSMLLSAFGNVWTLPVLFLTTLYPAQAELAIGYIAFCVVGWSPFFWTFGPFASQFFLGGAATKQPRSFQLMKSLKRIVNPPTTALVTAFLFTSLPLGRALLSGDSSNGPLLQRCLTEIARPILDVIRTIAMAGIAVQAIVLGAAFSFDASKTDTETSGSLPLSIPRMTVESSILIGAALVRFLIMPLVGWLSLICITRLGWISLNDTLSRMTVLIMSVMPSAQNSVVVLELQPETRHLVPGVARAIVGMYVAAIVPITLWITFFALYVA